MRSTQ
jgi:hypothetical protein